MGGGGCWPLNTKIVISPSAIIAIIIKLNLAWDSH
jgi:hypothetical protein